MNIESHTEVRVVMSDARYSEVQRRAINAALQRTPLRGAVATLEARDDPSFDYEVQTVDYSPPDRLARYRSHIASLMARLG